MKPILREICTYAQSNTASFQVFKVGESSPKCVAAKTSAPGCTRGGVARFDIDLGPTFQVCPVLGACLAGNRSL